MLDLGFREDLETLLEAAPAERRTLLLSATLPPEIRALARQYQRDACPSIRAPTAARRRTRRARGHHLRRAPVRRRRSARGGGQRAARSDASAPSSFAPRARAWPSCTRRWWRAGFAATAISGERAQAERDRALDQLRRGEARVLVATNVAARGLDLPDVDLIVHADLPAQRRVAHPPQRPHRTRRAQGDRGGDRHARRTPQGRATVGERARAAPAWTPPPTREAIAAAARERLAEELAARDAAEAAEAATTPGEPGARRWRRASRRRLLVERLLAPRAGPAAGRRAAADGRAATPGRGARRRARRAPRSRGELRRDGVLFRVNLGAKDNAEPRWLLPLICRRGGVTRREVGAIRIARARDDVRDRRPGRARLRRQPRPRPIRARRTS